MPDRRAKDELMRLAKERRDRDVVRFAETDLQKAVATDAIEREDPWGFLDDIRKHGVESGIVGHLVHYNDSSAFYQQHEEEIWDMLEEDRSNSGAESILAMLGSMSWAGNVGSDVQLRGYLAWYCYEVAVHQLLDKKEHEDNERDAAAGNLFRPPEE